jgi:hypothetical protein
MILMYWLLVAVGASTELDLAWQHDGWRLAGCSIFLLLVLACRRELLEGALRG